MANSEIKNNTSGHKQIPVWKNASFWHITALMMACSVFYYMDVIINWGGWKHLHWDIFYTVHDLHRALFLIPVMYATYEFRLKGIIVTSFLSLLVFLPRALIVSPYPDPLLRALIFMVSMVIMAVLLSKLLNNISERKKLEQSLSQAQNDLLREQAEEALCESEDKYKSLIDNIPDIVFTIDLEGKITFVSKRTKEILGYENAETINMNIFNFIPEEDRPRAIENLQKGMKGEKIKHFQIPLIAKSGEMLIFECSFTRIYKDGAVVGAQGTAVDITERKRAEEMLQAETANLDAIFESSPVAMFILDETTNIVRVNTAALVLCGVSAPDVLQHRPGKALRCVHSSKDPRGCGYAPDCPLCPARNGIEALLANGGTMKGAELVLDLIRDEAPRKVWMEIGAEIVLIDKRRHLCVAMEDISARKRAEATITLNSQRTQALLQLNQMTDATLKEITDFALEEAVRLTQSTIGYLAFLNEDESVLTMHSWSKSAMAQCAIQDKPILYPVETTGLWGEAVRQRQAVITNDYNAPNPLKKSYPEGHVAVWRHMNTPVFEGKRIVIVAGVGNKTEDYDQSDVQQLTLLMEGMWRLLESSRVEKALRESEERYRRITENMSDFISELDPQGIFKYNSPSIKRILGYNQEELIGSSAFDLVHPEDRDLVIATYMNGVKTESDRDVEQRYKRKDGTYIWLRSSGHPLSGSDGKNIGMIVNSNNITDRKRTEELLQLKNLVFDTSIAAKSIADIEGVITEANYAFLQSWGYPSKEEVIGNPISYFLNDPKEAVAIVNALNENGNWQGNFTAKKKDGSTFIAHTMATSIQDKNGKVTGYQSSVMDITEHKLAESQRETALEEIRTLNETLEQRIKERTAELQENIDLLEETNRAFVGRELRMIELKERIAELEKKEK